ncbi:hypothetical protein V6N12_073667 [Hibiscus sabdariffa]|uniref:Uncharacterized protein n=1 Tax=Hibiscus sabdariffa TaxID=183260 RepID=A0ABR2CT44_9ROSI
MIKPVWNTLLSDYKDGIFFTLLLSVWLLDNLYNTTYQNDLDCAGSSPFALVSWQPSGPVWYYINSDEAVSPRTLAGSMGGAFHDPVGNFILAYHRSLGLTYIIHAKL